MFIPYRSTAVTNSSVVVADKPAKLMAWNINNLHSAAIFVKFYNSSTTGGAVVGTTTPFYTLQIAANGSLNTRMLNSPVDPVWFSAGIAIGVVTGGADNNTTAAATLPIIELEWV